MPLLSLLLALAPLQGAQPGPEDVYVRVVDVGAGLCTIAKVPGAGYLVYDAGHWTNQHCLNAVREIVEGGVIELLVISHSDGDHLGNAAAILEEFEIRRIVTTGSERWDASNFRAMQEAIGKEVQLGGASVQNLRSSPLEPGTRITMKDATVTLVAGWHEWPAPAGLSEAERRNVISVVVRLEFAGHAVLFAGDAVGRRIDDPDTACKDGEKAVVDNAGTVPIASNVLVAPHHGADNGSATCFITAVAPSFVVFSAGHQHRHPRTAAAQRYLSQGVPLANLFRTDRGDAEGGTEWPHGRVNGCSDKAGDDDVEIVLPKTGNVRVAYRLDSTTC
jgi:beta-lactamase superfamily II metal-dependent hydrolase